MKNIFRLLILLAFVSCGKKVPISSDFFLEKIKESQNQLYDSLSMILYLDQEAIRDVYGSLHAYMSGIEEKKFSTKDSAFDYAENKVGNALSKTESEIFLHHGFNFSPGGGYWYHPDDNTPKDGIERINKEVAIQGAIDALFVERTNRLLKEIKPLDTFDLFVFFLFVALICLLLYLLFKWYHH